MFELTLNVGEVVLVHSNPVDAAGNGPAAVLPGFGGNLAIQWLPQTPGVVSKVEFPLLNPSGVDCQFTGVGPGVTIVNILGFTVSGVPKTTPFQITVIAPPPVGELDHFDPSID